MATLQLLWSSRLQAKSTKRTGFRSLRIVSEHDLDQVLGNDDGDFTTHGHDFSATAMNVRLVRQELHADLQTFGGEWRKASIRITARQVQTPDGWTHELVLRGSSSQTEDETDGSSTASTAKRPSWVQRLALTGGAVRDGLRQDRSPLQPLPKKRYGTPEVAMISNLRLEGNAQILLECPSKHSPGGYAAKTWDLDLQLGNNDGHFNIYGRNFSASARNPRLQGLKLTAELKSLSGEWCTDEIYLGWLSDGWRLDVGGKETVQPSPTSFQSPTLYKPLPAPEEYIRLCYIGPGQWFDPLVCNLVTRAIDSAGEYACLSYVWGSATKETNITLNGREVAITNNLAGVLQRLRWHKMTAAIWIDALCINQENTQERNAQVAAMPRIYNNASLVVIRLNIHYPYPDFLPPFELGHDWLWPMASTFIRSVAKDAPMHEAVRAALAIVIQRAKRPSTPQVLLPLLTEAIDNCAASTWFDRAWTLQEYLLADNAVLMFHTELLHARTMVLAFEAICRDFSGLTFEQYRAIDPAADAASFPSMQNAFYYGIQTLFNRLRSFYLINDFKRSIEFYQDPRQDILPWKVDVNLTVLHVARQKKASDPRDKLFAFISLADDVFGAARPDYARSVGDIYASFTANTIWYMGNFDIWCFIRRRQDETAPAEGLAELPSWAVDWTVPGEDREMIQYWAKYKTQGQTYANWGPPVVHLAGNIMTVRGIACDVLDAVSSGMLGPGTCPTNPTGHAVLGWMHYAGLEHVSDITRSPQLWDRFWHTLVGDHVPRKASDLGITMPGRWRSRYAPPTATHEKQCRRMVEMASARPEEQVSESNGVPQLLLKVMMNHVQGRRLYRTAAGRLGLCPESAKPGDRVFFVAGSRWPVLLRPCEPRREGQSRPEVVFELVGVCYVRGVESEEEMRMLSRAQILHLC